MKPTAEFTPGELVTLIVGLLVLSATPLAALGILMPDLAEQWIEIPFRAVEVLTATHGS